MDGVRVLLPVPVETDDLGHRPSAHLLAHGTQLRAVHRDRVLEGGHLVRAPILVCVSCLVLLELQHNENHIHAIVVLLSYLLEAHRRTHADGGKVALVDPCVRQTESDLGEPVDATAVLVVPGKQALLLLDCETRLARFALVTCLVRSTHATQLEDKHE